MADRHLWIDASAGVAGDMLLGALLDAGAALPAVQRAVDAVVPGSVVVAATDVTRAGQHGRKADVTVVVPDPPHRSWSVIRQLLTDADLAEPIRDDALRTFARLAAAEATVHAVSPEDVHFHEVGALDSIADVVGVCAALDDLGVTAVSAGPVAVGSGRIRAAHGDIGVPVPAVVELSIGWEIVAGGPGELTTPTGMALVTALAERCEPLPRMVVTATGSGAGSRDVPGRPNLTRVVLGEPAGSASALTPTATESMVLLEANVDDLDPRLWPGVLDRLLAGGAADAWLTPILMKKGRPAHTVAALVRADQVPQIRTVLLAETSTLGVRQTSLERYALPRGWTDVPLATGDPVAIKLAHLDGRLVRATPEFAQVETAAAATGRPVAQLLAEAVAAAVQRGLVPGAAVPPDVRPHP